MNYGIHLEEPLSFYSFINEEDSTYSIDFTLISVLSGTRSCGLFMLIEKMLKDPNISDKTARLALDLLRGIHHHTIYISPSPSDDPNSFVAKLFSAAENIVLRSTDKQTPLYLSAKRLKDSLETFKVNKQGIALLEQSWQDFSLNFFREKLYRSISRS